VQKKVTFIEPIWGVEKISAYKSADISVIPSRYDTMTIVALESGILKTPIIITKKSNFNEVKKSNGAIIVNANSEDISRALLKILINRKKLNKMGKNLQRFVKTNYDWNLISKKFQIAFGGKDKI
jgi:glycosyltransferase involved in cell wall biosynthesis